MRLAPLFDISPGLVQHMLADHLSEGRLAPTTEKELRTICSEYLLLYGLRVGQQLKPKRKYINQAVIVIHNLKRKNNAH